MNKYTVHAQKRHVIMKSRYLVINTNSVTLTRCARQIMQWEKMCAKSEFFKKLTCHIKEISVVPKLSLRGWKNSNDAPIKCDDPYY